MRRIVSLLFVVAACVAAVVLTGASSKEGSAKKYKIEFDNAFGLVKGGDFRVGNVTAGSTSEFEVIKRKGQSPKALVTVDIKKEGFGDLRSDAECSIRPQSLIGEYYVDCQAGTSGKRVPEGGTIPVRRTSSTIPQDLVSNIMRRPYRERFRFIINELGTGLAGRPDDLQEVLKRAHPGLRETSKVLRILGDQNKVIERFIVDSDTVVRELERNKADVVRFVREAGDAAEISATRREDLARTFERLPTFLDELRPTMARLGELSDEQVPLLSDLEAAAPSLNTFFTRLGPFAEASRPAIRSLGDASLAGTRAFREGRQEIRELRTLAKSSPRFAKPLRNFLVAADDRRYASNMDPRARATAPPAPDPTAATGSGPVGFTAFEGLTNFFFWQTLSVNMVDDVAHMLRNGLTATDCSPTKVSPPKTESEVRLFQKCNQYLGPRQPGITGLPGIDPTDPLAGTIGTSGKPRTAAETRAKRAGERRGPNAPDAGPVAGQNDISKPQITLPPQLKGLLDGLAGGSREKAEKDLRERLQGGGGVPAVPNAGGAGGMGGSETQLLDYLLAP